MSVQSLTKSNMKTEDDLGNITRKEVIQLLLFADDMILYMKDPSSATRKPV